MGNVSILSSKTTDGGDYSGGSWVALMPLQLLTTQDPLQMARTVNTDPANTWFRIDCGTAPVHTFTQFVLLRHNLTTQGRVQFIVTNDPDDAPENRIYDSGLKSPWEVTVGWGSRAWGAFPWDGIDSTLYPSGTVAIHTVPDNGFHEGRYVFVRIFDASNPVGYVQAGRFLAGTAWQPSINVDMEPTIRWVDPSETRRTRGGLKVVRKAAKYRTVGMVFSWLEKSEAIGFALDFDRVLGKSEEFFLMMDPDEDAGYRFQRAVYASRTDTSDVVLGEAERWSWRFDAEELV